MQRSLPARSTANGRRLMGWLREDYPDHEGYMIGFVLREGCDRGSGLYRELMYPLDATTRRVELLAAGCDCGWRSPRWSPKKPADWGPWSVFASEDDDAR
jgi:hypothetical protein